MKFTSNGKQINSPPINSIVMQGFLSNCIPVLIFRGQYYSNERISNFWYWHEIDENGNVSKELESGYGKPIKETKMDNGEQFDKSRHKIKNNSTVGKIPFEIKAERMTVYLTPEQNNDKYKQSVIKRYANRHKPIV